MTGEQLAKRLNVNKQRISRIEHDENLGKVKLDTLKKVADAMDCVFVYTFIPKQSLEQTVRKQAQLVAKRRMDRSNQMMRLEKQELSKTDLMDAKEVMEVNLWANKELIDTLQAHAHVKQIVGISSGAAVNGSKGWGAYSLSKAGLNMLLSVYAKELPDIHFTALAPGIIGTPMVQHIIDEVDDEIFPSAKQLKHGTIQTPQEAAKHLIAIFSKLLAYESGSFLDVRTMENKI